MNPKDIATITSSIMETIPEHDVISVEFKVVTAVFSGSDGPEERGTFAVMSRKEGITHLNSGNFPIKKQ